MSWKRICTGLRTGIQYRCGSWSKSRLDPGRCHGHYQRWSSQHRSGQNRDKATIVWKVIARSTLRFGCIIRINSPFIDAQDIFFPISCPSTCFLQPPHSWCILGAFSVHFPTTSHFFPATLYFFLVTTWCWWLPVSNSFHILLALRWSTKSSDTEADSPRPQL